MKTLWKEIKSFFWKSDEDILKEYQDKGKDVNALTRYQVAYNVVSVK